MRRFNFFQRNIRRGRRSALWGSRPKGIFPRSRSGIGFQSFERVLIRAVVLSAVLLVLVQMGLGLAKDPVDYYISVAQNLEAPTLDSTPVSSIVTPDLIQETIPQTYQITLKAIPAAPVRVIQNGKILGTLARGELEIPAQTGTLQLDGTNVASIVRVEVINKDPLLADPKLHQTVIIEHNTKGIRVGR